MTAEEAIKVLKLINLKRVHPFYSWEEMEEVRDVAIEALEKTIAKKPLYKKKERKDGKCYIKREYYICPYCGKKLFIQNHQEIKNDTYSEVNRFPQGGRTKRCSDCGQAIDWGEEE